MDSERFDRLVRSLGQPRSRRQTLRGLAGAGALLALLAATPVAAGKTGKPNNAPKNSGKGQPGNSPPGNSPPGSGQNGQLGNSPPGGSQNGSIGAGRECEALCGNDLACIDGCEDGGGR